MLSVAFAISQIYSKGKRGAIILSGFVKVFCIDCTDLYHDQPNMLFKESQIICLEYEATCLYGEVIQLIPSRGMCWFRPICMTISNFNCDQDVENYDLIHLRSGSDLLWPTTLFRPALDTEVISLLVDTEDINKPKQNKISGRQHLNQFVRQVWVANQDKF